MKAKVDGLPNVKNEHSERIRPTTKHAPNPFNEKKKKKKKKRV
jgi:hypothetical protein